MGYKQSINTDDIAHEVQRRLAELGQKVGLATCNKIISISWAVIYDELLKGNDVTIHRLGKFRPRKWAATRGVNPQTGEPINIPERIYPHFRPSDTFKDHINQAYQSKKRS